MLSCASVCFALIWLGPLQVLGISQNEERALCALTTSLHLESFLWDCNQTKNACNTSNSWPESAWRGLRCFNDSVAYIDLLDPRGSQGVLPTEIGLLSQLVHLSLTQLRFFPEIPTQIGALKQLQSLRLAGCQISEQIPTQIGNLKNLQTLDLLMNDIPGTIPTQIWSLSNLQRLDLSYNQVSGVIPPWIQELRHLQSLRLQTTPITGTFPTQIGLLQDLTELLVSTNGLCGSIPTQIGRLTNLRSLWMFQNMFSGQVPTQIGLLTRLEKVDLSSNLLEAVPSEISSCQCLNELSLSMNPLQGVLSINNLPSLKILDLSGGNIATLRIKFNPSLDTIHAQANLISAVDIANNSRLIFVNLQSNLLTDIPRFLESTIQQEWNQSMPLETTDLSDNKINITLLGYEFNPYLKNLDLSRNLIHGTPTIVFRWDTNDPHKRPDYPRRRVNMMGNRFTTAKFSIEETFCYWESDKNSQCSSLVTSQTNILPQSCSSEGYYLSNQLKCEPCLSQWKLQETTDTQDWKQNLSRFIPPQSPFHVATYLSCTSCDFGERKRTRSMLSSNIACDPTQVLQDSEFCSFPCKAPLTTDPSYALQYLVAELRKPISPEMGTTFLSVLISTIFPNGVTLHIPTMNNLVTSPFVSFFYSENELIFELERCKDGSQFNDIASIILNICSDIVPSLSGLSFVPSRNLTQVKLRHVNLDVDRIYIVVGALLSLPVGIPLLLFIGSWCLTGIRFFFSDLRSLPEEMSWSYLDYLANPRNWTRQGSDTVWFHFREFTKGTNEWERVISFFDEYLDGKLLPVDSITAIYNPKLLSSFLSTWNLGGSRNAEVFAPDYSKDPQYEQRQFVANLFKARISKMSWNVQKEGNWIVPVVHGTSVDSAYSICQKGFAALGKTDGGWYGRGIYFTTYARYTLPYMRPHDHPALIISWVLPGHFFPVIEPPESKVLLGAAIKGGSSHYIVTDHHGNPSQRPMFDELVIANEFSIAPAFILTISNKTKKKQWKQFQEEANNQNLLEKQQNLQEQHQAKMKHDQGETTDEPPTLQSDLESQELRKITIQLDSSSDDEYDHLLRKKGTRAYVQ